MYHRTLNHFTLFWVILTLLSIASISLAEQYLYPDLAGEANLINFADFAVLAENWQKTGSGLAGDFDDSNTVDINDLVYFSYYWLASHWECETIDIDSSGLINFEDFLKFADCWLSDTGSSNYKSNCDFDDNGQVDIYDLKAFCNCWLKGSRPEDVFEAFKTALAAGDINEAVTYIADFVADDYRTIFNENIDKLQDMVNDMGTLSFEYRDKDIAVYEISNLSGTNFYPLVFTLDDNGRWKIAVF